MTRVWRKGKVLAAVAVALVMSLGAGSALADAGLEVPGLTQVASGWMHTCGLGTDARVYCWGNNATANLGDGTAGNARPVARRVDGVTDPVTQVTAGADHTCALTAPGDVWCWGGSLAGQMSGIGTDTPMMRRAPGKLTHADAGEPALPAFTQVSAGNTHSCATGAGGVAWCWGDNGQGQLGDCPLTGPHAWTSNPHDGCAIDNDGAPRRVFDDRMGPVRKVVAGASHTCAISTAARLWCWGANDAGQLGIGSTSGADAPVAVEPANGFPSGDVADVALGTDHTCAITGAGAVFCWGDNTHGRIGSQGATAGGQGPSSLVPQRVTAYAGSSAAHPTEGFTSLVGVSTGLDHSCAWRADGKSWCWGRAVYGQLGDDIVATTQPRPRHRVFHATRLAPTGRILGIAAGYNHTCSVNEGGAAHCWGHNGFGQAGDGTLAFHFRPAKVLQPQTPA